MLRKLLPNKFWPIAVDLGADSVKVMQLHRVGGALSVLACARWQYPDSVGQDPQQRRQLAVSAVRDLLRNGAFRGRRAVTALSYKDLCIKNVRLPHMPKHEKDQAIRWEAKERFGFEIVDDRLRYIQAGEVREGNEVRDEVIMLAVPEETVEDRLALMRELGLRVEHIEAEPVALFRFHERYLRRQADEEAVSVLVDLGMEGTRVVVARGRKIIFIKSIETGGREITETVGRQLNLSSAEAMQLRMRTMPDEPPRSDEQSDDEPDGRDSVDWTVHDAIRGVVETLTREISLCLRYCSVTFRGLRPRNLMLTGGGAYDPALVQLLRENLTIKCEVARPLQGIDVSTADFANSRRGILAEWAVCTGMAIRNASVQQQKQEVDDERHRLSA